MVESVQHHSLNGAPETLKKPTAVSKEQQDFAEVTANALATLWLGQAAAQCKGTADGISDVGPRS